MQQEYTLKKVTSYIRNHWFKIGLAVICLFVILKKDLSFNLNLNTPIRQKIEQEKQPLPVEQKKKRATQERFTEITPEQQPAPANPAPVMDKFDLSPSFGGEDEVALSAIEQLAAVDQIVKEKYIKRFARVVITERQKFGIPASIILANAMLHSAAGQSTLSKEGNNHFKIPCTDDWQGESERLGGKCYRQYENAWTSFRDHSLYLTTGPFSELRGLGNEDYKSWAKMLEKANFSDEPKLGKQLIRLIEEYELFILDEE